jgi:hypothetical protein
MLDARILRCQTGLEDSQNKNYKELKMKRAENQAAQGDVLFIRVPRIPSDMKTVEPKNGHFIVAHSETGHHHTIGANGVAMVSDPRDPFTCYLQLASEVQVVHHRPFDTHETFELSKGSWMVRRQREYTPEGLRMVED